MVTSAGYTHGLHELDHGCFAYLQPDGGWGWSNAGLIVGDGQSLLVDTLFDLGLTAAMLDSMADVTTVIPRNEGSARTRTGSTSRQAWIAVAATWTSNGAR